MAQNQTKADEIVTELLERDDVRAATTEWGSCDVAVLVPDGTDVAPIRRGLDVVDVTDYDAAPYVCLELDVREGESAIEYRPELSTTPDEDDRNVCPDCGAFAGTDFERCVDHR